MGDPCCPPCFLKAACPPCSFPYPQVCMTCPPPCPAPTQPNYVRPLALPTPPAPPCPEPNDPEEDYRTRIANFYNGYNKDYHNAGPQCADKKASHSHCNAVNVDGKPAKCDHEIHKKKDGSCEPKGCPTGFKPCEMKLCAPPGCDPLATWKATIQPCPPKPTKRVSTKYEPGECKRPCCKHWKLKDGPCLYDKPCKAQCINHPPGMKPTFHKC